MAVQEQAGNRPELWLKKASTAQRDDVAGKIPVSTDTDKAVEPNVANKNGNCWVRLSKVKRMIDQALMVSERKRDSQLAEMAEKTVFDARKM